MRHTFLAALGSLLAILVIGVSDANAQAWATVPSGVTNDLNDLSCVDERTCYAVGGAPFIGGPGIVIKTINGGDIWTTQPIPTTQPLRGIHCPTTSLCYAAGSGGVILKTTNGGDAWTSLPSGTTSTLWDIWAPTSSTVMAVGDLGTFRRSTDSGATWTGYNPPVLGPFEPSLHALFCASGTCWIGADNSTIRRSTDAGVTWTTMTTPSGTVGVSEIFSRNGTTVWGSASFVQAIKSIDGGVTWSAFPIPAAGGYSAIEFVDDLLGWMGGNGTIIKTTNGGMSWTDEVLPTRLYFRDLQCFGANLCYVVGDDGTILRYGSASAPAATTDAPAANPALVAPVLQADLIIGDRSLACPSGELGLEFAEYRYTIVVRNTGTADAGPFSVRLEGLVGSSVVGTPITRSVAGLTAGASTTITGQANVGFFNPTASAAVTVRVTTDSLGQVAESNETNNVATIEQTCATAATTSGAATPTVTTIAPVTVIAPTGSTPSDTSAQAPTKAMDPPPTSLKPKSGEMAAPSPPTLTKDLSPEEKDALTRAKNEERRQQLEKIQTDAPTALLGIEKVVEKKEIVRDIEKERLAEQKVEFITKTTLPTMSLEKKQQIQGAMKAFIAYGAPTKAEVLNTPIDKLGGGERAGVVNSFTEAFGKLPETERDWEDVMKISIGRFPSQTNLDREKSAEETFKKIYKRTPIRTQANDNACVVVISYGLRPDTRRLAAEAIAIKTYKSVFKKRPASASDWDTIRCIAYSGAKR